MPHIEPAIGEGWCVLFQIAAALKRPFERNMNQSFLTSYVEYLLAKVNAVILRFLVVLVVSVAGVVLVVMFLTTFLRLDRVFTLAPFVIAFFAMMSAYSLVEKLKHKLKRKYLASMLAGITTAVVSFVMLNLVFYQLLNIWVLGPVDLLLFIALGAFFSEIGATIAIRYFKLQRR